VKSPTWIIFQTTISLINSSPPLVVFLFFAVLKTGVISQAAGSAYAEFGGTKLMVGVYGPRQSDRKETFSDSGRVNCEFELSKIPKTQQEIFAQNLVERELSAAVQTALEAVVEVETFPKLVLDVFCTVLERGGSEVAVAITAAALAIADAGIEMKDLVTACSVSKIKGALVLDPTDQELSREDGGMLMASLGTGGEIAQLVTRGRWTDGELKEALELCLGGCAQLDGAARQALKEAAVEKINDFKYFFTLNLCNLYLFRPMGNVRVRWSAKP
jgi:exosome complex component MTR3